MVKLIDRFFNWVIWSDYSPEWLLKIAAKRDLKILEKLEKEL